jgi:hypothetical protein
MRRQDGMSDGVAALDERASSGIYEAGGNEA